MKVNGDMLDQFIDNAMLVRLIEIARGEDGADITSQVTIPAAAMAKAAFVTRRPGVLCGSVLLELIAQQFDARLQVDVRISDGQSLNAGDCIATIQGPLRSILTVERTALNFITHLSGIATLTRRYVDATSDTKAVICDTRKTLPALRGLEKHAVVCGGGKSHRMGLSDAVLIKDNHLAFTPLEQLATVIDQARKLSPQPKFVEVEIDRLDQLQSVLTAKPDIVLLDNMDAATLKQAVRMRDELAPDVLLEASGGVNLQTVRAVAQSGIDRIAVGAITHSAPALDIGLDIV